MKAQGNGPKRAYDGIFDALLRETLEAPARALCNRMREILFSGFEPHWTRENQKFDFSFSSPARGGFRFSVSDYGEKAAFEEKLLEVFSLFGGVYDRAGLAGILGVMRRTNDKHQTTFGLEWLPRDSAPRLKVYFEELRGGYPPGTRIKLLKRICAAAGLTVPCTDMGGDLAAIGLDFLPSGRLTLKSYLYSGWAGLGHFDPAGFGFFARTLSKEKRAFFYKTSRYNSDGSLESHKLYKVYEVRQITDFSLSLLEIYAALIKSGACVDVARIEKYHALAIRNGSIWYPVLCAMDIAVSGEIKLDSYFSVR